MKKTHIKVTDNATYKGQTMSWTEEKTGKIVADGKTTFFHFSDTKIKAFKAKETCFFKEFKVMNDEILSEYKKTGSEYLYSYTPKAGTEGVEYMDEVRFDLKEGDCIELIARVDRYWKGYDHKVRNAYRTVWGK